MLYYIMLCHDINIYNSLIDEYMAKCAEDRSFDQLLTSIDPPTSASNSALKTFASVTL